MLLTLSTTHDPATDLAFLLGRNAERCHSFPLPFGQAHVFYTEATQKRCTAALMLEFDPVRFVRDTRNRTHDAGTLGSFVNDRPYVASSLMSIAMARAFSPALSGESRDRPKLVTTPIPLEAHLAVLRCAEGEPLVRRIFEPLGYTVRAEPIPFAPAFKACGKSPYHAVTISGVATLRDLVTHLYMLLPVIDDDENYAIGDDKLTKLVERREGFLRTHPERERIARRFTRTPGQFVADTLARLVADDTSDLAADDDRERRASEDVHAELEKQRTLAIMIALREAGARRVIDLACGTGALLKALMPEPRFRQIAGMDASARAIELSRERLGIEKLPPESRERVLLFQGAPTYRDARLAGFDAACLVDVLEQVDRSRLPALERVVFEFAKPASVVVTTTLATQADTEPVTHADRRAPFTRAAFEEWATEAASRFGYTVRFASIGPKQADRAPSHMAVLSR